MKKIKNKNILFILLVILLVILSLIPFIYIFTKKEPFLNESTEKINKNVYTAIIVEPRKHKALEFVLNNIIDNLSLEWNILIFHGTENIDYVKDIINKMNKENKKRITLVNLNVSNLSWNEYSELLVSKKFYDYIPTETFLIFQTDSMICSNNNLNKDSINRFLLYDYVGAPFAKKLMGEMVHTNGQRVGNGGFSLRKKSKMLEIIEKYPYNGEPEDQYFINGCSVVNCKIPTVDEASLFANETVHNDKSFAVHKPWWSITEDEYKRKLETCVGLDKLKKLNEK